MVSKKIKGNSLVVKIRYPGFSHDYIIDLASKRASESTLVEMEIASRSVMINEMYLNIIARLNDLRK